MDDDLAQPRTFTPPAPPESPGPPAVGVAPAVAHDLAETPADRAASPADPADESRGAGDRSSGLVAGPGATGSQLRRFIKSRPWVPMHELRRRFGIEGPEDEMTPVDVGGARIYVGLPTREAGLLADLIRQGEVGYELVHDPDCPAVAGVYPMRPVVRT